MLSTNLPLGNVIRPQMWMIVAVAIAGTQNAQHYNRDNRVYIQCEHNKQY